MKTAVLVDDSRMEVELMARILEDNGIRVVGKAYDGNTGLSLIRQFRPTFAILDLMLPMLSGVEVARTLFESQVPTALFVASGSAQKAVKEQCAQFGVRHFIAKPYDDLLTWNELAPYLADL